ncbi:MAG: 16S rRNA (adenine(1518)-N(6)/adenine(1519)-N(6))-dimethyltransferase RsmA [Granulosicoccus sp.]
MGHQAKKRFGQNFLHDTSVIDRILGCVNPQPGQHLVEIGPGQGALTSGLLQRAGDIDAIELDRNLIEPLQRRFAAAGNLRLHNTDALQFDFHTLLQEDRASRLRLVGNLPYNISTPLLFHLLKQAEIIDDMHFMLQKEVVERMAATPGSKTYGRLSVILQVSCKVIPLFDIGPEAFDPQPKVESSVVRLQPLREPLVEASLLPSFSKLVTLAFAQRRKTLRNNLKGIMQAEQIQTLGIDPGVRSETLSIDDFIALHASSLSP